MEMNGEFFSHMLKFQINFWKFWDNYKIICNYQIISSYQWEEIVEALETSQ